MCGKTELILPVLLCGGNGTRLWPLVDENQPKHTIAAFSGIPMLVETARRFQRTGFLAPLIVCNRRHLNQTVETLNDHSIGYSDIIAEPATRDTTVAIAFATLVAQKKYDNPVMMISPIDHCIPDFHPFEKAAFDNIASAKAGRIVTFGIQPTHHEPAYGYLQTAESPTQNEQTAAMQVVGFEEKPAVPLTGECAQSGLQLWNSGIFLAAASTLEAEIMDHCPAAVNGARNALALSSMDDSVTDAIVPSAKPLKKLQLHSFDKEVMQHTKIAVVAVVDADWHDLGNWHTISATLSSRNQVAIPDKGLRCDESSGNMIIFRDAEVIVRDIKNVIVVANANRVLVQGNSKTTHLDELNSKYTQSVIHNEGLTTEAAIYRKPWGSYTILDNGRGYLTKRLNISPGASTSRQYHKHRAEHWVVVEGQATVIHNETTQYLDAGQSIFIGIGDIHKISNQTDDPLILIETQLGAVCEEGDIVRLQDEYGRC